MANKSPNKTEERAPRPDYKVQSAEDCKKVKSEVAGLFSEYKEAGETGLQKVLQMGDRLWAVKNFLKDGKKKAWDAWCESDEVPFGSSQANRYIRIFKAYQEDPLKLEDENKFSVRAGINLMGGKSGEEKEKETVEFKDVGGVRVWKKVTPTKVGKGKDTKTVKVTTYGIDLGIVETDESSKLAKSAFEAGGKLAPKFPSSRAAARMAFTIMCELSAKDGNAFFQAINTLALAENRNTAAKLANALHKASVFGDMDANTVSHALGSAKGGDEPFYGGGMTGMTGPNGPAVADAAKV